MTPQELRAAFQSGASEKTLAAELEMTVYDMRKLISLQLIVTNPTLYRELATGVVATPTPPPKK